MLAARLLLLLALAASAAAFATYVNCADEDWKKKGGVVMGAYTEHDTATTIKLKDESGAVVECGGELTAGITYTTTFDKGGEQPGQVLLEAVGCKFSSSTTCGGERTTDKDATVTCEAGEAVEVIGGWSAGYGAVSFSNPCSYTVKASESELR